MFVLDYYREKILEVLSFHPEGLSSKDLDHLVSLKIDNYRIEFFPAATMVLEDDMKLIEFRYKPRRWYLK